MKTHAPMVLNSSIIIVCCSFLLFLPHLSYTQFQRNYGNILDDSFSKVIQDGTHYYVLGQTEPSSGALHHATVSRLDVNGVHQWTLSLNIGSVWNDAVLTPSGNLIVVGSTLPFNSTTKSLMGVLTSSGGGNFICLRSYDEPGRDFFNRIVKNPSPQNASFPYYILGSQNQAGSSATTEDVVLLNVDANCNFNWKKIYISTADDEFFRDLEALPNGDLLLAGNNGTGRIFITDNTGAAYGGVQISNIVFNDVGQKDSNSSIFASANGAGGAHVLKFGQGLFPLHWDVIIPELNTISQVWERSSGGIYVTGRGTFNGANRAVIIKLVDNGPSIAWVKYLNTGSGFIGGSSWLMPSNQLAFTDSRVIPGGFGGDCAFISLSDLELLEACQVSEVVVSLVFADPVPDGPILPAIDFRDFPMGSNLTSTAINWLQNEVCNNNPCEISIDFSFVDNCGHIQFASNTSGPGFFTYSWNFGDPNSGPNNTSNAENPVHQYSGCGMYVVSLTVECPDGTILTDTQSITVSDNTPPNPQCALPFGVELDANCMFNVTVDMIDEGSFDNCQIQSMSISPQVLNGCGVFPITLTVEDWCGNKSTCATEIQTIEVVPPILLCPPNLVLTCDNNLDPATTGFATATDNCDPNPLVTYTEVSAGQMPCEGQLIRTWTATDNCGNESSCVQSISVFDNVAPVAVCVPPFIANLDASCVFVVSPAIIDGGSSDNCEIQSMSVNPSLLAGCGIFEITLTVIDLCGNSSTCTTEIQTKELVPPTIICPPDLVLSCDNGLDPMDTGFATATDNCDPNPVITYSDDISGQITCDGQVSRTWTATDNCGNVSTCVQIITVFDDVSPVISCTQNVVVNSASSPCESVVNGIQWLSATDNCGTPSVSYSISGATMLAGNGDASGQIFNPGVSTVTYTAMDECGNLANCSFTVSVECAPAICCPEFSLMLLGNIQPCDTICLNSQSVHSPLLRGKMFGCKNSTQSYYVFPNLPGFTYNWTMTGGTLTSTQGDNPGVISWGSGDEGSLQVIISDATGTCRDTLSKEVCLQDSPTAAFTVSPSTTICTNELITFTNSSVGANAYLWDFGNGNISTSPNPPLQSYPAPGTYTVLLTVSNGASNLNSEIPCGCIDTASVVITVVAGTGPVITPKCKQMLCPGDTATYSVSPACLPLNWTVNGGTIISTIDSCVTVQWDATAPANFPASVSVTTGCPGTCGNAATYIAPVLWPNIPISGPKVVCVGATSSYSLPTMPGTFYSWIVTGGTIIGPNQNTASINVQWGNFASTGTITCNYNNPYTGCSGSSTCPVDIKSKFTISGPSPVCEGVASTYGVTSGGTATWTISPGVIGTDYTVTGPLAGVSLITVTWTTPGNYTVKAVPPPPLAFCNPSSSVVIAVNPAPVLNTIVGTNVVCPNELYDYTVSSNLPGEDFTWSFSTTTGGTITPYGPNNSMASVNFTGPGPWTLVASQIVKGCPGSSSFSITKVPAPILPNTPVTVCIGGQTTTTVSVAPGSGPGPYTWSSTSAASLINGQGTGTATYELHGAGTITVSNCCGPSNSVSVSTTPPPTISITKSGSLCAGNLQLSAPACGTGTTYQWFGPMTGNTQTINVTKPGTYTVQVQCPDGCISSASCTVAPVVLPTVSISTGDPLGWCSPSTPNVILQALTSVACSNFQWYNASGAIPGATSPTYTATSAGTYFVVVTCGVCVATSNSITVQQITCTGGGAACTGVPNPLDTISFSPCNPKTFSINVDAGCSANAVMWDFGDGNSATGTYSSPGVNSVSHTYANASAYLVTAKIICNGCEFTVHTNVNVPLVADFLSSVQCGLNGAKTIDFLNTSQILGGWNVSNVSWSSDCGTPITPPNTGYDFSLNTSPCSPNVTMSITLAGPSPGQTCTDTITYPFQFIDTTLSIIVPTVVCKDSSYSFYSSLSGPGIVQYQWTLGIPPVPVSQNNPYNTAFDGNPVNPTIGLTVVDTLGCTYTATATFPVVTPRPLTVAPVKVCPDCLPPTSISATPIGGFINYQWYQNGLAIAGANSDTHILCQFNASGNYYVTAEDNLNGKCPVTSDTVQVVYHPKPVADIQGETIKCVGANGPYTFNLSNANADPNNTYLWTTIPPGAATFNPGNMSSTSVTATSLGTYQFVLSVTDAITGCMAMDTFCVYLCERPLVTASGPSGILCEGQPHTFTASATPPGNYVYVWSNGATGPVMTTSQAGFYSVTVTDPECGCSSTYFGAGYIQPKPSIILFPAGCDTLCDKENIIPPLVLGGPFDSTGYTVQWYLDSLFNNPPFYTGPVLNLAGNIPSPLSYGLNNISIIVTYQGCSDTSNVYNVFIERCCECTSELTLVHGDTEYPVFCDPHMGFTPSLPCPADDVVVFGYFGIADPVSGEPCEETDVTWELVKPDLSTTGGITTNFTHFTFPKDSIDTPGLYCLTLTTISGDGLETCVCKVTWIQEPCACCTTLEEFCDRLENDVYISVDHDLCKATLNLDGSGCDYFIEWVDWNYPSVQQGPFLPGSMPMYTYPGSGTYTVCYLAVEKDSINPICFEKVVCDTITVECLDCYCGTFSELFFPLNRNVQGTLAFCDSTEVTLGCPAPGNSIQLTGLFQCAGPNCPPTAQVSWELYRVPNTTIPVASSSTIANPYFGISILPTWYATPGSYELRLIGHCGLQECPCIVRFNVNCPDPCPCDVEPLFNAVNQGFSVVKYPTSCKACFVPVALSDCEIVEWHLDSPNGPLIGTSIGNNGFCHTFPGAGTYTVVMKVTRLNSDGSICTEISMSQTVTLTCLLIAECRVSDFVNPTFSEGAVSGGMLSGGMSTGWTALEGEPIVLEGEDGSFDGWSIELSGNLDVFDMLSSLDSVCMEREAVNISMRAKQKPLRSSKDESRRPFGKVKVWTEVDNRLFLSIPLSVFDSATWVEIETTLDLSYWDDLEICNASSNGVLVQLGFAVSNALGNHQGGEDTYSSIEIDQICINGTPLTAVEDIGKTNSIRLFPNPTLDELVLQFKQITLKNANFQIIDLWGRTVQSEKLATGQSDHLFSIATIPAGIYFVKVTEDGMPIWVEKIIKQ